MSYLTTGIIIGVLLIWIGCQELRMQKRREQLSEAEKWHEMALVDALTEIANRAAYASDIKKIKKTIGIKDRSFAVILFDVDNFKNINDTQGHLEGDRVLKACAQMLQEVFSHPGCKVYRIGGDEFAVIARKVPEFAIIDMMQEVRRREENELGVYLSKGYSVYEKAMDFSTMFAQADEMLYADKNSKKIRKADVF